MLEHHTQEIMCNTGFALDDFDFIPKCKQQSGSSQKIAPAFSACQASMAIKVQRLFAEDKTAGRERRECMERPEQSFCTTNVARRAKHMDVLSEFNNIVNELNGYLIA